MTGVQTCALPIYTRLFEIATRAQFPQDYKERMEIKQDVKQEVKVDFASEVTDLIKQLRKTKEE